MTGREALKMAAGIVHETDCSIYEETAVIWLNVLLSELFDVANRRREADGGEALRTIPQITSLEEELPYDAELTLRTIPKGLTARLFAEDCDPVQLAMYRQDYQNAVAACDRAICRIEREGNENDALLRSFGW